MDIERIGFAVVPIAIVLALYFCSSPTIMRGCRDIGPDHPKYVSDEEFLAAVPNASPEMALRVRQIVSEQLGIPEHKIHPDHSLINDLGAD